MITVLDGGGVLAERARTDQRTGDEILDHNHFRGNYKQIHVDDISQWVVVVRPINKGRHSGPDRDRRREVELADGRVLVLDGNYSVETHPEFKGLFAIPDPDEEGKYIVIMFENSVSSASNDTPHVINVMVGIHNILSWTVNTPETVQDNQGLRSIIITERNYNPLFQYLLTRDERSFLDDLMPLTRPIFSSN